ncbi:hypothetical protein [Salibacterium salarium]|uniref:hypothetical protein n=1 Tax=Salibacterium salarium TaxID=284579 RepID=UPI00163B5020|nr:hypothetical protein [Salibacterium salarium]
MKEKKKKDNRESELEQIEMPEVEHRTDHPGEAEFSLQSNRFVSGENKDLNEH